MHRVYEVMTKKVLWLSPDDHLRNASKLMAEFEFRHLPVVEGGKVVGMISEGDVQQHSHRDGDVVVLANKTVGEVMSRDVVTCAPSTYLAHVAATMIACKISCLPVVSSAGELVGIITTTDLLDMFCMMEEENGHGVMPLDFHDRSRPADQFRVAE